jgi:hypothetical protein
MDQSSLAAMVFVGVGIRAFGRTDEEIIEHLWQTV